jgi:hypothetical protein
MPLRSYYLLSGPVRAATDIVDPAAPDEWQRPDLFWPDDRAWFVATDVDFYSLYIGGTHELTSDIAMNVPTPTERVGLGDHIEAED